MTVVARTGAALAAATALLLATGCAPGARPRPDPYADATAQGHAPIQQFDERSGTTVFVVRAPIVLARARTDVAANVRDYATLVALQEDHVGSYTTWLVVHRWSTVDPRISADAGVGGQLTLVADGRSVVLTPAMPAPPVLARKELLLAPPTPAQSFIYAIDLPTLRYLAAARELTLHFNQDAWPDAYTLWQDGRVALQGLIANSVAPVVQRPQR